ncbi:MAG: GMC family oxidoreductase N-terminal domain-containing protein, partial [Thaumarchaeota archaeon]|nr:GMC family oxidoreductase N-terminal domain-containing protein [Nitrososphaerota archaeon]
MTEFTVEPSFDEDKIENVDVCVIGTGAGGAVVAYNLAQAGLHVLMLEKGGYYPQETIENENREEKLLELWKNRGAQLALTYGIAPLLAVTQGECVGGSTIINYGMSFKIPPETLDIWKDETGIKFSA